MTIQEAKALLIFRESMEGGIAKDIHAESWATVLEGVGYMEALEAAVAHYQESTEPLKPAHILKRV